MILQNFKPKENSDFKKPLKSKASTKPKEDLKFKKPLNFRPKAFSKPKENLNSKKPLNFKEKNFQFSKRPINPRYNPHYKRKPYAKNFGVIKESSNFRALQHVFSSFRKYKVETFIVNALLQNLHLQYKSLLVFRLVNKFFLQHGLYLNKFHFRINYSGIQVFATSLGVFRAHKLKKRVLDYRKKLANKKLLLNLAEFILNINIVNYVKLKFYYLYLPRKLIEQKALKPFKKHKKDRFFWESLQIVAGVFHGYASASILGGLMYTHIRRNPRRIAFVAYIKRLLTWHFRNSYMSNIQGVRIEVKGRFNAKSRAKKQILSSGRVRMHEKSSNVDYAFNEAFTKFGCLGIKVWVCPKKYKYKHVINTKKNKIQKSTKRANSKLRPKSKKLSARA